MLLGDGSQHGPLCLRNPTAQRLIYFCDGWRRWDWLGSQYYGEHTGGAALAIPQRILNFDAFYPFGKTSDVLVTGAERTTFSAVGRQRCQALLDLEIKPDPEPGQGHYYRSDHFSLARVGVPSFSISAAAQTTLANRRISGRRCSKTITINTIIEPVGRISSGLGFRQHGTDGQLRHDARRRYRQFAQTPNVEAGR